MRCYTQHFLKQVWAHNVQVCLKYLKLHIVYQQQIVYIPNLVYCQSNIEILFKTFFAPITSNENR